MKVVLIIGLILGLVFLFGCSQDQVAPEPTFVLDRYSKIPVDAVKMRPEMDEHAPKLHSDEYEEPIPLAVINSAGAEDSPFVPADRDEMYFFFTPDVDVPVEKQILDGVTGIYVSKRVDDVWQEPKRVVLQDTGKLSLDGCEYVQGDFMLFCTAREGYTGIHWFSAEYIEGEWQRWMLADFKPEYNVGELHIYGDELYFHSEREGGKGGFDIWMSKAVDGEWQEPKNIEKVNTVESDGWPYITPDGEELWINRWYMGSPGVFRSKKIDGEWQEAELIVSSFAGEPTLDSFGNLYFVHHFYKDGKMIEADIYVSYKK